MNQPTMPTRTLLQGGAYVTADKTDIRATFERARQDQRCASSFNSGTFISSIGKVDTHTHMLVNGLTGAPFADFLSKKWVKQ